jgi:integrase
MPLQRTRDLAVQVTDEAFADEGFLVQWWTPALLKHLGQLSPADDEPALQAAVMIGLIWEGPVLLHDAAWRLQHLRLGHYDWERGLIQLWGQRGSSVGRRGRGQRQARRAPLRLVLRPTARLLLNFYLLSRASCGRLDLSEADALVFPPPPGGLGPRGRANLNAKLARSLAALDSQSLTVTRVIHAARSRALQMFPPISVAVLSGRLRFAPVPEEDLRRLATPVTGMTAMDPPEKTPGRVPSQTLSGRIGDEEASDAEHVLTGIAEAMYLEAHEGFRVIQRILARPASDLDRRPLARLAQGVLWHLERGVESLPDGAPSRLTNLRLALRWLAWQLDHPTGTREFRCRSAPRTIAIRTEPLVRILEDLVGDRDVRELDDEDWIDFVMDAMAAPATPNAKKSMRQRLKAFHRYLKVCAVQAGRPIARVDWGSRELAVASEETEYSFPLPWEVQACRHALRARVDPDFAEVLEQATSLAYHGGLRRNEVARLFLGDVTLGLETILAIRVSKTRSGRRCVPLHRLAPRDELERFRRFVLKRHRETGGDLAAPLLGTPPRPQGFSPEEIARPVAAALTAVAGRRMSFHSLRHGFASLFPLRWFVAFYGGAATQSLGALLKTSLFGTAALARFRRLFVPLDWEGTPTTTQPFHLLSILMGHSGPEITINAYVHTLDWLQRLYIDREITDERDLQLTVKQAARASLRSVQAVYQWDGQGGSSRRGNVNQRDRPQAIHASEVVRRQVSLLDQLMRRPQSRANESQG